MNVIIYFSLSKEKNSKRIALSYDGDIFELKNNEKTYKNTFLNMVVYGYKTMRNKDVDFDIPEIDFEKYDTVTLVSPVWAGRVCLFMKKYLEKTSFSNKKINLVGTCKGGYDKYFESFEGLLDESNEVIEKTMYVNGAKQ